VFYVRFNIGRESETKMKQAHIRIGNHFPEFGQDLVNQVLDYELSVSETVCDRIVINSRVAHQILLTLLNRRLACVVCM
jgi:hypothetical protein